MSLERRQNSPFWYYRFEFQGRRFFRSCETTNRREAEQVEKAARAEVEAEAKHAASRKDKPMTLDEAAARYWLEVGSHHKRNDQTFKAIEWLVAELGKSTLIAEIRDSDVARLVAKWRSDRVVNVAKQRRVSTRRTATPAPAKLVSPARVNRSVTEPLRKILLRARKAWGQEIREIDWRQHMLKEPRERIRSMSADEEARLFAALPAQFHAIVTFYIRTGVRQAEACALTWSKIDLEVGCASILGKGGKVATIPLPDDVIELLKALPRSNARGEKVFRYANGDPITTPGIVSAFRRARTASGVEDLRIHDLRHTAATRLLKASGGNIKLAQKMLRHEDLTTTANMPTFSTRICARP